MKGGSFIDKNRANYDNVYSALIRRVQYANGKYGFLK